ncbi:amino acid adenylation domain-containing protein [Xenorhabdus sp. DI]|uniref:non-ribosomal peptide synthetase n=1 Tax=Xenorhabdus doucetiae TaxID=351671 RepID=UPI0019C6CA2B|nr:MULTISPECIES: non-ribosomal peptide synthetase [unclassified Xenorhabdus]MBD2785013.1 amino acid adenylation domain-containing protein [Xenorhabdus sp. 3]MBD2787098.1 amino acid adenylation domain-containing protein [Xenorhabdus sp. DI]
MCNKSLLSECHQYVVHKLFERQATQTPDAVAVRFGGQTLSYDQLNRRANRLAYYLRRHHLGHISGDETAAVGIYLDRGMEMIIAVLGVLKAGAAYVPVDLSYPAERQSYILHDSNVSVVITRGALIHSLPDTIECIDWDQYVVIEEHQGDENLTSTCTADRLAYLIYTSGSTGKPKGVCMPHKALVNLLIWQIKNQGERPGGGDANRKTLQFSPLSFDVSFQEIFSTLSSGGELVLIPNQLRLDPLALLSFLSEQHIERIFLPYVALNSLASAAVAEDHYPETLIDVVTAGEQLVITSAIRQFFKSLSHCHLHNHYGPSETHVVTAHTLKGNADDWPALPAIGQPIDNVRIYLLDDENRPVVDGSPGELCVAGIQLACGYHRRPEETAAKFVDIVLDETAQRVYRTGDLARWRPDGLLDVLGRIDFQIKIRGHRVELGEIEALLMTHPAVRDAVVVAQGENAEEKRLVAFVIVSGRALQRQTQTGMKEGIQQFIRDALPDYMCPAAMVIVERFPLSASGKIDRKAFPLITADELTCQAVEPPQNAVEQMLAEVWSGLLNVKKIGRNSHFLQLGGHSLLTMKMMLELRRRGFMVDAHTLYQYPVLMTLAAQLQACVRQGDTPDREVSGTENAVPWPPLSQDEIAVLAAAIPGGMTNIKDIYPLGPLQQGMFYHSLAHKTGDPYVLWQIIRFSHADLLQAYLNALRCIIARHDTFRVSIHYEGLSRPVQVVWREAELVVEDVGEKWQQTGEERHEDLQAALTQYCNPAIQRFDMTKAPLQRCLYFYDAKQNEWVLLHLLHHMTVDHTTIEKMQQEIEARLLSCRSLSSQSFSPQPFSSPLAEEAPLSFRQTMVDLFNASRIEGQKTFFDDLLRDYVPAPAPLGIDKYLSSDMAAVAVIQEAWRLLPAQLGDQIRQQAKTHGVSVAAVFHLAWAKVIACLTGQDDVVFGTVLLGRGFAGEASANAMGQFINTLPLRIRLNNQPVLECLWQTQDILMQLVKYEQASLAQAQKSAQAAAMSPLFISLLNYRHSEVHNLPSAEPFQALNPSPVAGIRYSGIMERTNYPISINVDDFGQSDFAQGFVINAQVEQALDPELICDYLQTALQAIVLTLANTPHRKIGRINILPAQEKARLMAWNQTESDFLRHSCLPTLCLHTLIEAQVQRTPDAIAVEFADQALSYGQLNQKANQLARYLRTELNVAPDTLVGVCLERSMEMVVALLAILKAGGAYVPLDPRYPRDRLDYMLHDAAPRVLLSHGEISAEISALLVDYAANTGASVIDLHADAVKWSAQNSDNLSTADIGLTSSHLAYVIYTSGSTGRPKGVMNEHRGVVNRLVWMQKAYSLNAGDAVLQKTPFSFDVSVWEFFWPLMYGARLVVATPEGHKDPRYLSALICQRKITTLHFVPSMLSIFLQHASSEVKSCIRQVFCSGEALPARSVLRFHERFADVELHNLYGPTEAAIDVTAWDCSVGKVGALTEKSVIPIGKPIDNIQLYILDAYGQPTPIGVVGELYISGIGVARGYLNQPELTAEKFIKNLFRPDSGQRMYRTGDLARYLPNGDIEYLGRNDFQVKLRGLRIELGEIEAALLSHDSVKECVVLVREDTPGDARLVAYVIAAGSSSAYSSPADDPASTDTRPTMLNQALKVHLQACLPAFMIPSSILWIEALPLTANGKLDRKALPAPSDISVMQTETLEPPRAGTETKLAQLWSELLKIDSLGRQSHFFEAGGHSLLAVTLMMRIQQEFGVSLLLSSIVSHLDLAAQAALIEAELSRAHVLLSPASPSSVPSAEPAPMGLIRALPTQEAIYKALKLNPQDLSNNSFIALSFETQPDLKRLRNLLQSVLSRHVGLSAQFMLLDGELYLQPARRFVFRLEKRQSLGSLDEDLRDFIRPFSLEDGVNVRGRWLIAEPNPMLLLDFSHACIDGSGLMQILNELAAASEPESGKLASESRAVCSGVSLADYSALFYGEEFVTHRQQNADFWHTKLQDWLPPADIETDIDIDNKPTVTGSCLVAVDAKQKEQIEALTSRLKISMPEFFMTVFLRFKACLEYSASSRDAPEPQTEQLISTIFHGRDRLEQQTVIAPLMMVLPVRVQLMSEANDLVTAGLGKNNLEDFAVVSTVVREAYRHYLFDTQALSMQYPNLSRQALLPTTFFGYFQKEGFDGCICGIPCRQLETPHVSGGQWHWNLVCEIAEHTAGFDIHLEARSFRTAKGVEGMESWEALFNSILQNALNVG